MHPRISCQYKLILKVWMVLFLIWNCVVGKEGCIWGCWGGSLTLSKAADWHSWGRNIKNKHKRCKLILVFYMKSSVKLNCHEENPVCYHVSLKHTHLKPMSHLHSSSESCVSALHSSQVKLFKEAVPHCLITGDEDFYLLVPGNHCRLPHCSDNP